MKARQPRLHDRPFLNWLKERRCDVCGASGACDPAHLKSGNLDIGKPSSGTAKPDDKWSTSLCRSCHDKQHARGDELAFWREVGIDPFALCIRLYAEFGGDGGKPRGPRKIKVRKPREQRAKVPRGKKLQSANRWPKGSWFS